MIRCKDSVRFAVLRPYVYRLFETLDGLFNDYGLDCWITCGTEAHKEDDPHTHGFALDIRSKHMLSSQDKHDMRSKMQAKFGSIYTVILENEGMDNEHFHIQVRKGLWRTLK